LSSPHELIFYPYYFCFLSGSLAHLLPPPPCPLGVTGVTVCHWSAHIPGSIRIQLTLLPRRWK
jgi:hypothetical protein